MAVTYNLKGTSNPYFKIGKSGSTLFQGTSDPTGSYTVVNGDIWFDTTNSALKFRESSAWSDSSGSDVTATSTTTLTNKTLTSPVITNPVIAQVHATDFTLNASNDITLDAGGSDIILSDDDTIVGTISMIANDLAIRARVSDQDLLFKGNDGGSEITALWLNMSEAGDATFNSDVTVGNDLMVADYQWFTGDNQSTYWGVDSDVRLTHVHDSGLVLKNRLGTDNTPMVLTLQTAEEEITTGEKIGVIDFQAPGETSGTDAILVAAGIEAVAEGTFAADNNATKLSFKTASSGTATETMSLSSGGTLTATAFTGDGSALTGISETKPTITSTSLYLVPDTLTSVAIVGTNFASSSTVVPIVEAINSTGGVTRASVVSFTSATSISASFTLASGDYRLRVENPNGNAVVTTNAILQSSIAPTWTTAAGSIASMSAGGTISTSVVATSDSAVTYAQTSGTLPGSISMSSAGAFSGTESGSTTTTTYTFEITPTDAESQSGAAREFTITISHAITGGGQFN